MTAIVYCPVEDQIYEWDGWFLSARVYCDVGGIEDETGSTYYLSNVAAYGSFKEYGLIRLDTLED